MPARKSERGQGFIEYGLLLILIAVVLILIVTLLGTQISALYSQIVSSFPM
jgi:pilus assembly protein Flp/PilA